MQGGANHTGQGQMSPKRGRKRVNEVLNRAAGSCVYGWREAETSALADAVAGPRSQAA